MELHPILERGCGANAGLWYVLSAMGDCPSERVGHTLTYVPNTSGHSGKVYVIGGANPSGSFSDSYILDLDTFSWDITDQPGLRARYEHSAFLSTNKIYVFGGADQGRNHNDVQSYDIATQKWTTEAVTGGNAPSPRTYHNATIASNDRFIVYSGGQSGADPVGDRQVHCYNASTATWSTINVRGDPPKPRHGHLVVGVGNKVIVHGGMSGQTFYDDLHVLDLDRNTWTSIKQKKVFPSPRAAHAGAAVGTDLYVFGGMSRNGALDDLYKLDTTTMKWTRVAVDGPPPAPRLDFAMTTIRLRVPVHSIVPSVGETLSSSAQAKEVLDSQLSSCRLGSAGSAHSSCLSTPGSAGSQRSVASIPGLSQEDREALFVGGVRPPQAPESPSQSAAAPSDDDSSIPHKLVDMLLVCGGMDTEGEIYDDAMVFLVGETPEETKCE